jgi:hypothetical protein
MSYVVRYVYALQYKMMMYITTLATRGVVTSLFSHSTGTFYTILFGIYTSMVEVSAL